MAAKKIWRPLVGFTKINTLLSLTLAGTNGGRNNVECSYETTPGKLNVTRLMFTTKYSCCYNSLSLFRLHTRNKMVKHVF